MTLLAIKIKIHDRIYPMKVDAANEAFVRKASKILEERIKSYQQKLRIHDPQDLLAMVAFDCLVEALKVQHRDEGESHLLAQKISSWGDQLEELLQL